MITGMENTLKASTISEIESAIEANHGDPPAEPNAIPSLAEGVAKALIPFIVQNLTITVAAGIATTCPAGAGATTAPGTATPS